MKNIEPTSYKMIVIGEEKELDEIKADMEYTETRSFKDKVIYVDQEELFTVKRALQSIWIFRKSLGL